MVTIIKKTARYTAKCAISVPESCLVEIERPETCLELVTDFRIGPSKGNSVASGYITKCIQVNGTSAHYKIMVKISKN